MKVKLLRKIRKRFYWTYDKSGTHWTSILDKIEVKTVEAFNPYNINAPIFRVMMFELGLRDKYIAHLRKKEQKFLQKKYKKFLQ